ncbi:MAG: hypothetical protein EU532_11765 [Promethearchaeota archaeon]|nr:MAG: hypothetical protein EU532_11765 [Candidatus Lokiarchaeota archaeon]
MNEITGLYIIDSTGAIILSYENHIQGGSNASLALLSHFLYALKSIAKDLKEDELKSVEISNNKFFLNREKKTRFLFIVKSHRETSSQKIEPMLKEIKDNFLEKFTGDAPLHIDEKIEILSEFKENLKMMFKHKSNMENFMETI